MGHDPDREGLVVILLDLWGEIAHDRVDAETAALYEVERDHLLHAQPRPEGATPLWVHVMGGGFGQPGAATTTWSVGVDEPKLLDFLEVGNSFFWESYLLG